MRQFYILHPFLTLLLLQRHECLIIIVHTLEKDESNFHFLILKYTIFKWHKLCAKTINLLSNIPFFEQSCMYHERVYYLVEPVRIFMKKLLENQQNATFFVIIFLFFDKKI